MIAIFDWDGTLMDSTAKIINCMQGAAERVGLKVLDAKTIANIIGLGLPEAVRVLYPDEPIEALDQLRASYSHIFVHEDATSCVLFPRVNEGLELLESKGVLLAIATGKSRRGLDRMLAGLGWGERFVITRCADETASKPNPLMLQQILAATNKCAETSVMVGDTEYDLAMAASIGMPRLALTYGAHEEARLRNHDPQLVTDQFSEVTQWILARS